MKRSFRLEELDCANCAAKMEHAIQKIEGVTSAQVNFLMQKLTLEAPDEQFDGVLAEAVKVCRRVEPDCRIVC